METHTGCPAEGIWITITISKWYQSAECLSSEPEAIAISISAREVGIDLVNRCNNSNTQRAMIQPKRQQQWQSTFCPVGCLYPSTSRPLDSYCCCAIICRSASWFQVFRCLFYASLVFLLWCVAWLLLFVVWARWHVSWSSAGPPVASLPADETAHR